MAQLIDWLAFAGARTSGGTVVSSGAAWFYVAGGGTTLATVYSDVDGTIVATNPVALDAGGRASVYVTAPVRIAIQDSAGADVMDEDQADVSRAEAVQVDNTGWSDSYLDSVLTKLYTSVGGVDGQYQESSGATARTVKSKFAELSISVKDFGAKGDGLAVDTTAIQAAINRAGFLGGATVYFPPGTYVLDQGLNCGSNGVSLVGAGTAATVVSYTSSSGTAIAFTGCTGFRLAGFTLACTSPGTGTGIALTSCASVGIRGVSTIAAFQVCLSLSTSTNISIGGGTKLSCRVASATSARAVTATNTSLVTIVSAFLGAFSGGYSLELLGTSQAFYASSADLIGPVKFDSTLTGAAFKFVGNSITGGFTVGTTALPAGFQQSCNGIDGYTGTLLTGATFTPDLSLGYDITINATTTGSAYTVAPPVQLPSATQRGFFWKLTFWAHAGGAITGWGVDASYHLSSGPSTVDTHRTSYLLWWDPDALVHREISRSDTT